MTTSEIDALKVIDTTLATLDQAARTRVLRWAWEKYGTGPHPDKRPPALNRDAHRKERKKGRAPKRPKVKGRPTIVRDLNLRPKGKKSFIDFASAKRPTDNQKKCTVAVYYLQHELGLEAINVNHVFTCFKNAGWRAPADLPGALFVIAHRKGWIDTSDMNNITLTTHGENLVEHDLPLKEREPKK